MSHVNDQRLEDYQTAGATEDQINDAEYEYLRDVLGYSAQQINDMRYAKEQDVAP